MRTLWLFGVATIFLSLDAFASCRVPEVKSNGEFFKANVVFAGTVMSERYVETRNEMGWFYQIHAKDIFKGPLRTQLTVYTGDDSNRLRLQVGEDYLLFAYLVQGRLWVDSCGNSASLAEARSSIDRITRITRSREGEIEGWLAPETDNVDLIGIQVQIRSGSRIYKAVTNKHGLFRFIAPPGRYKLDFSNGQYYINGGDAFGYDPDGFKLHAGESAALQLVSSRHPTRNNSSRLSGSRIEKTSSH